MVELVLCIPILVLFLCGIIEFGFVIYQTGRVYEAARQCARYCAMGVDAAGAETYVQTILPEFSLPDSAITVASIRPDGTPDSVAGEDAGGSAIVNATFTPGCRVTVTIDFAIRTLTPLPVYLIAGASGDTRRVRGQATFRREPGVLNRI